MNRSAREGKSVKRFERSSGPDIALYKNYITLHYNTGESREIKINFALFTFVCW